MLEKSFPKGSPQETPKGTKNRKLNPAKVGPDALKEEKGLAPPLPEEHSDKWRMAEYAQTGDPVHLTPGLARKMQVSPAVMAQVPGHTKSDLEQARFAEEEMEAALENITEQILKKYGIDREELSHEEPRVQIRRLLDAAGLRIPEPNDQDRDITELVVDEALSRLGKVVLSNENGVHLLFDVLRVDSPQGLQDIEVFNTLVQLIFRKGVAANNSQAIAASLEFLNVAHSLPEWEFEPYCLYFVVRRLADFCEEVINAPVLPNDRLPIEVSEGQYAFFTEDGHRLYIADRNQSETIGRLMREVKLYPSKHLANTTLGYENYFMVVPPDLDDFHNLILDSGDSIHDVLAKQGIHDHLQINSYISFLRSSVSRIVEYDFSIQLKHLSIPEQFYFLNYAKEVTLGEVAPVQEFTKKFGTTGLKTFLALGQDPKAAEWILGIGKKLPEPVARQVFEKYAEISASVQEVESYVAEHFRLKKQQVPKDLADQIRQNLLVRGKNLLRDIAGNVTQDPETILQKLSDIQTETVLFTASTRALVERNELNLNELKGASFEIYTGGSLEKQDVQEMTTIWERHYQGKYPEALETTLRTQFQQALTSPQSQFYLLHLNGKLISFLRADELSEIHGQPVKHLASFFTDMRYARGKLGQALFSSVVEQERVRKILLKAECDPRTDLSNWYLSLGFEIVDQDPVDGVPTWHIELRPQAEEGQMAA